MPKKKVEVYDKKQLIYPFIENDHVTFSNGMKVSEMLDQGISMPTITHNETSFKVGVGDSDVSSSIVDSSVSKMVIKGQTYQNILPEPSTHVLTNNKEMFKVNEELDANVEVVDGVAKSAILKGQTLVNLVNNSNEEKEIGMGNFTPAKYNYIYPLTNSKEYTVQFEIVDFKADRPIVFSINNGSNGISSTEPINKNGIYKFKTTLKTDNASEIWFYWSGGNHNSEYTGKVKNIVVLDGDYTNIDIPYFEGMQSVKMPVLTTTGKNLFDFEKTQNGYLGANPHGLNAPDLNNKTSDYIRVKPNTTYTYSFDGFTASQVGNEYWTGWYYYTSPTEVSKKNMNRQVARGSADTFKTVTFTTPSDCYYVRIGSRGLALSGAIAQLEEGSTATPYEPYKSNILSTPEEVVLRSLPNGVKDTLNLNTGEYVQRIKEIVLDGSESWNQEGQRYWTPLGGHIVGNTGKTDNNVLSNKYVFVPVGVLSGTDITIGQCRWGVDQNFMVNQDNGSMGVASWKTYLSQNPLIIQCQLATPIVKTVDLSSSGNWEKIVLNGSENWSITNNTHFYTKLSDELSPDALLPVLDNSSFVPSENTNSSVNGVWYGGNVGSKNGNIVFNVSDKTLEQFKQCLFQNPITVWYPVVTHKDSTQVKQPIFFKDGHIIQSSGADNLLIPTLDYQAKTSNSYVMDLMKTNTKYTMKAKSASGTFTIDGTSYGAGTNGTFTTPSSMTNKFLVMSNKANEEVMILEGDVVSKTIPYFKGIKSAFEDESQIEVLSTGKNIYYNNSKLGNGETYRSNGIIFTKVGTNTVTITGTKTSDGNSDFRLYKAEDKYPIKKGTYTVSCQGSTNENVRVIIRPANGAYREMRLTETYTFTATNDDVFSYIIIRDSNPSGTVLNETIHLQIEECSQPTTYEPYKSNNTKIPLLSPLCSLPNGVCDELIIDRENNKAKIVQRVGVGVLDGTQYINMVDSSVDTSLYQPFFCDNVFGNMAIVPHNVVTVRCDNLLACSSSTGYRNLTVNAMYQYTDISARLAGQITKKDLGAKNVRQWFEANPTTVYYQLETPVITEVDLEGFPYIYKDGHIFLNGEIVPTTEIVYSINQCQQISASNEDIIRHEKELTYLQKLIAQYVKVDYESALLSLKV